MNQNGNASDDKPEPLFKPSFLSDLAAKMAAGPPKKPVGLLKKSNVAERAEQEAAESNTALQPEDANGQDAAQANLANILKQGLPANHPKASSGCEAATEANNP